MASSGTHINISMKLALCLILFFMVDPTIATRSSRMNVIDRCWRRHPNWARNRPLLAMCSIGFTGKMTNNVGRGVRHYTVTDPSDDPINPRPGTLRYGATLIEGKVWIKFHRSMHINLQKPLLISSFTAIDGRGTNVHIASGACFVLHKVTSVIIHGLHIHHCQKPSPGKVIAPGAKILDLGRFDVDTIAVIGSSKVWIDHNTLYQFKDGLVDVTQGSTAVTISNNWFKDQDKVMLLGHDDGYLQDRRMKVTLIFNRFGPNCHQRMPRARHGYVHVANNIYEGWGMYAIGGSMNPSIKSDSNVFISSGSNKVTWRGGGQGDRYSWNWKSKNDHFVNGAFFRQSGNTVARPNYNRYQSFIVENAGMVRSITSSSGALSCTRTRC
ncbi:hypothetical protein AAC387_Pa01g0421 [Persea americana]